MLKADKTSLSHLALISAKITDANSELIFKTISDKTRRDVEGFVSRVTPDGRLLAQEPEVDLRLRFKLKHLELLDRAREVLAHGGKTPSMEEALLQALEILLDNKDPVRRAERAVSRTTVRPAPGQDGDQGRAGREELVEGAASGQEERQSRVGREELVEGAAPGQDEGQSRAGREELVESAAPGQDGGQSKICRREGRRPAIRASVRHQVWTRDGGQCTWKFADGSRCRAKSMLELEHGVLWSRGGGDGVDNLSLKCRFHNQFSAEVQLGAKFMKNKRARVPADF